MYWTKPAILLFTDWFTPAYKAGGPIRSCVNFTYAMKDEYNIFVVTSNRDFGETENLKVEQNIWIKFTKNVKVIYLSKEKQTFIRLRKIIIEVKPDYIYLNSMFSYHYTLIPIIINFLFKNDFKVILAPRGMLHEGAIKYKKNKKNILIKTFRRLHFLDNLFYQATDNQEKKDVIRWLRPPNDNVYVIQNFPKQLLPYKNSMLKKEGELRLVYISRLSPKKNLIFLISLFKNHEFDGNIYLDIYGPEEQDYWIQCQNLIKYIPPNIKIQYHGSIEHDETGGKLKQSHFFTLPTFGENFGHAIFEAFVVGLPVLISDQTPWKKLSEKNIGWDLPLSDKLMWLKTIQTMLDMDNKSFQNMCRDSYTFANDYLKKSNLKERYKELFSSKKTN